MELIDLNNTTENYLLQISGNVRRKNSFEKKFQLLVILKCENIEGMRLGVNVKKPIGHRLQSIQIVCTRMNTTTDRPWAEYESLNLNSTYRVVSNDYLTSGGNGYKMFIENVKNKKVFTSDSDALISYFQSMPVLKHLASNRIIIST